MKFLTRKQEYGVFLYRILLAYVFYFIARLLFLMYNQDLLQVDSIGQFFKLSYYGLTFDTTAILYVNLLFIFLSLFPLFINTRIWYQKILFYVYFVFNLFAYALNFVDLIYYKYNFSRTTRTVLNVLENEENKGRMFVRFGIDYWHVFLLFICVSWLWIMLYKKYRVTPVPILRNGWVYLGSSLLFFGIVGVLVVGGIRGGDFKKSTRPINMVDASRHVDKVEHSDLVLNTPFAFIRTFTANSFKKVNYSLPEGTIEKYVKPIKEYHNNPPTRPNIVVIITESFSREYLGAFNKDVGIENFESFTPFLDSLAQYSLIFPNAFANGKKSIHGMSSVLAGIPSFDDAFTSSAYSKQPIESLVSTTESIGYKTSFFHGAPNGSMGFQGFATILGIDHYFGMEEYNNDEDFDGSWGIWDEPFLQYMVQTLNTQPQPFFSTVFTVSSHEPYVIPKQYKGKFPKGYVPMHQTVGYTDYAFKKFFESAKKQPWYDNTIFVITSDHGNQIHYGEEFYKVINRNVVPILFFSPKYNLQGVNKELAQQMDIYPTLLDLIGYEKPFRSWGRSLTDTVQKEKPFVLKHGVGQYQFLMGNYICIFDGTNVSGIYDIKDKALRKNLLSSEKTPEMGEIILAAKAFVKDYFDRIIDNKLDSHEISN